MSASYLSANRCLSHTSAYVSIRQHTEHLLERLVLERKQVPVPPLPHQRLARNGAVFLHLQTSGTHFTCLTHFTCFTHFTCCTGTKLVQTCFFTAVRSTASFAATLADLSKNACTSAYVSIRRHTSAYVSRRQQTSAYVTLADLSKNACTSASVSIRQHPSASVSIRQHTQRLPCD